MRLAAATPLFPAFLYCSALLAFVALSRLADDGGWAGEVGGKCASGRFGIHPINHLSFLLAEVEFLNQTLI